MNILGRNQPEDTIGRYQRYDNYNFWSKLQLGQDIDYRQTLDKQRDISRYVKYKYV